jgi:hypothetical protein
MQMTNGIRAERAALIGLPRAYVWFSHHRGATVELPGKSHHLTIGFPLTAPRAVICAIALHEQDDSALVISGSVRLLASPREAEPARLVFIGRAQARLARQDAESLAGETLVSIADCILFEDLLESVA